MAFTARWITAAGTVVLSDGNPYSLEGGSGLGAAEVRNLWERGPQQDGVTDLGYRIEPRTLTLPILFAGTSDTDLDGKRDTLQAAFSPRAGLGTLQIVRDDGGTREIYARRSGPLDMPLVPAHRPGHLHKTVVQLFAPEPSWTEPTQGTVTFLSPSSDWWLAFNTIGSANVLEHVENPTQGQAWSFAGTLSTNGSPWMVAFRSGQEAVNRDGFAYLTGTALGYGFRTQESQGEYRVIRRSANRISGTAMMLPGTHNYFHVESNGTAGFYRGTVLLGSDSSTFFGTAEILATDAVWRSSALDGWEEALPRAAVYNIAPTPAQLSALNIAMESGGSVFSVPLVYEGDLPEYPIITIIGPISDPILTNTTTGESLDFTGFTIGSGDYYTIDTRYGRKTVTNSGGDNKIGQLSSSSDLVSFHIEPAPNAAGGTNIFSLSGTAAGTATSAIITYHNRYESW